MKYLELLNKILLDRKCVLEIDIPNLSVNLSNLKVHNTTTPRNYGTLLNHGTLYKTSNGGVNNYIRDILSDFNLVLKSTLTSDSVYKLNDMYYFFTGATFINVLGTNSYQLYDMDRVLLDTQSLVNRNDDANLKVIIKALYDLSNTDKFSKVNLYTDENYVATLDFSKCRQSDWDKVFVVRNGVYNGYFVLTDANTYYQRCDMTGYIMTGLAGGFNERYHGNTRFAYEHLVSRCKVCKSTTDKGKDYCSNCEHKVKDFMGDDISTYEPRKHEINSYDHRPSVKFVKDDNDALPLYLGVELEVDTFTEYDNDNDEYNGPFDYSEHQFHADMVLQKISPNGYVYAKSDGSLNSGFEIVSHPITLENHYKMRWDSGMKALTKYNYSSHNVGTCGMHVHINRDFFGESDDAQYYGGAKLAYLLEKYWESFLAFSRRKNNQVSRWASKRDMIDRYTNHLQWTTSQDNSITNKVKKTLLINAFKQVYGGNKYVAINTQHAKTYELRIFRGTLKYDTFIATLEFVDNLARVAKGATMLTLDKITFADIIKHNNRENLKKYWEYRKDAINFEEEQN